MFSKEIGDRIAQLEAMREGVDYRLRIEVRKFSCMVRPLTIKETEKIAAQVADRFRALPKNAQNSLSENLILAKETLQLASTSDVDVFDPSLTEAIMDHMTPDEVSYVHRQYLAACDKVNPVLETMPVEEIKALVEAIKKKDLLLTELSFLQAVNVSRFLILGE